MNFILAVLWSLGVVSLLGVVVSFVVMEQSRISAHEPKLPPNFLGNYRPEYFSARGQVAQAWCARLVIAFTASFLVGVTVILVVGR
jgi:hypothetical protein